MAGRGSCAGSAGVAVMPSALMLAWATSGRALTSASTSSSGASARTITGRPLSSSLRSAWGEPSAMISPRSMMITWSQICSASERMCVLKSTVWSRPSTRTRSRNSSTWKGSRPMVGLVEDEHLGIVNERLGDAHALAHTLGERADAAVGAAQQVDAPQHLARAALAIAQAAHRGDELQVAERRHVAVEWDVLRQVADAPAHLHAVCEDIVAGDDGAAGSGRHEAGEDAHGSGFAGAVWAQEPGHLAGPGLEGDVPDGAHVAITLAQVFNFDHGLVFLRRALQRVAGGQYSNGRAACAGEKQESH